MNVRTSAAVALAAAAGLALSACSPQLENPSPEKVDTATSQDADSIGLQAAETTTAAPTTTAATAAAGAEVQFIDCFGEAESEPVEVSTDCTDPAALVTQITWTEWENESASGTGINPDGSEAVVELSTPTDTGAATVFTTVTIDGVTVAN